ncbi:YveK family protein [Brevibacillus sp. SIMBA_040]|uniref:YveK family protein n=1 Tax=unclassified Brevibacillus TaxID=2684853 RepID=UPI00397BC11E
MNLEFVMVILQAMRARWILMTTIPLLCVACAAYISYFVMVPTYEATATMLVKPQELDKQDLYNSILSNQQLIKTYSGLIQTRKIAQDVIRKLDLSITPEDLLKQLEVKTSNISFIITVTYTDPNPLHAVQIVNEISRSFSQNINLFMNIDNVMIVDEAEYKEGTLPVSPKPYLNMAAAFCAGLFMVVFLIILIETISTVQKKPKKARVEVAQLERANYS